MEKRSKELLELEHKDPSSSKEAALLVFKNGRKAQEEKPKPEEGKPFTAPLPKSQVLGRVQDFLGVISEANKNLQLSAKDNPEEYDIEVLKGNESEYIEMDLMLGVADLHTPEAMLAAEAAIAGNQPVLDLPVNGSSSESESSSDDDDDEDEDDDDDDEPMKADSPTSQEMQEDVSVREKSEHRPKSKRPKIVELS